MGAMLSFVPAHELSSTPILAFWNSFLVHKNFRVCCVAGKSSREKSEIVFFLQARKKTRLVPEVCNSFFCVRTIILQRPSERAFKHKKIYSCSSNDRETMEVIRTKVKSQKSTKEKERKKIKYYEEESSRRERVNDQQTRNRAVKNWIQIELSFNKKK